MVVLRNHVKKRETEKEYKEFCVLCTHISLLTNNEEVIQQ